MTARFKVCVQQFVEEIAVVEIDAPTAEEAAAKAVRLINEGDVVPDWADGDEIEGPHAYTVKDGKTDEVVWER